MRLLLVALAGLLSAIAGCNTLTDRPELSPDKFAPSSPQHEWRPSAAIAREESLSQNSVVTAPPRGMETASAQPYDLAGLIDVALRNNPRTRRAWEAARSAAAVYGASQAPYYPQASVQSDSGFARVPFELPGSFGVVKQWQSDSALALTYTLLDFGRRASASEQAREELIAANFSVNRTIQGVVFGAEQTFYAFDAVDASVVAARQYFELAKSDFDSVKQRDDWASPRSRNCCWRRSDWRSRDSTWLTPSNSCAMRRLIWRSRWGSPRYPIQGSAAR